MGGGVGEPRRHCSTSSEAAQVLLAALGADLAEDVAVQLAQLGVGHARAQVQPVDVLRDDALDEAVRRERGEPAEEPTECRVERARARAQEAARVQWGCSGGAAGLAASAHPMCVGVGCASTKAIPIMSALAALLALCAPFLLRVQMPCGPR